MNRDPNNMFDPRADLPVKSTLKVGDVKKTTPFLTCCFHPFWYLL
uniref:Uncharacterized protein n=1 Tax=Arundo donax TaxID=35708 RepID=A0A0A9GSF1_ARUDO